MSIFQELKRRNVFRVTTVYAIASWLLLQVADVLFPILTLPGWAIRLLAAFLILGLPVAIIFAWAFEMTPDGLKRERDVDRSGSVTPVTGRKIDRVIIGLLVFAVGYLFFKPMLDSATRTDTPATSVTSVTPQSSDAAANGDGPTSVAVLPFVNMSPDPDNEYFSDGISEEILNVLVKIEGLRVPSRTSSFAFKGQNTDIAEIAKKLDVDHVLEGSVRKSGNTVRVTAQLIDVATDAHLWSDTYDRELADIFAIQDEISQAIVEALKVTLAIGSVDSSGNIGTSNVDAYNSYLRGRHFWNKRTAPNFLLAIEAYEEAIAADPMFARPYSALAETYALMPEYGGLGVDEAWPKLEHAATRALELDPRSAETYTALAYAKDRFHYRWDESPTDYLKAIELNPDYATARQWYGEHLAQTRSFEAALEQNLKAKELDPVAPIVTLAYAIVLEANGRHAEAQKEYGEILELTPNFWVAVNAMAWGNMRMGDFDKARKNFQLLAEITGTDMTAAILTIEALSDSSKTATAIEAIHSSKSLVMDEIGKAGLLAYLHEDDLVFEMLEEGFKNRNTYVSYINVQPEFQRLRPDPRFQDLLRRMNMDKYQAGTEFEMREGP